jgi:hypothetical protein
VADHPVKVPPELFAEWRNDAAGTQWMDSRTIAAKLVDRAAQWGYDLREPELQQAADQELEACCEWVLGNFVYGTAHATGLRIARRPKPPTLAEQGLADFDWLVGRTLGRPEFDERSERIRAALNRLAELEAQQ